jgi:hypothetical protein
MQIKNPVGLEVCETASGSARRLGGGAPRPYATRERSIEAALRRAAEARGGLAIKFTSPGCKGVPDRVILLPGAPAAFVEVKRPGEKPTTLQAYRHREMRRAGALVHVLDALADVEPLLARIAAGEQGAR